MKKITLGRTNLQVTKTAFGALPIQRCSVDDAVEILRIAKDSGINYFDTARAYTDSEEKLGIAFKDCRKDIIIATKTHAKNLEEMKRQLDTSLKMLQTDYIDVYQFHNAVDVPTIDSPMYKYMLMLKEQGVIGHIGISAHVYDSAFKAIESGLYETLQYPIFCLSDEKDIGISRMCEENNMGIIAMKGMGGGMIDDAKVAFSFFQKYENICIIWGIQKTEELEDFISLEKNPPIEDKETEEKLQKYREELKGGFCRSCGYCASACPVEIKIYNCARMTQLLGRAVWQDFITESWQEEMKKINECMECRKCVQRCPYDLDIPSLLRKNLREYNEFLQKNSIV